MGEPNSLGTRRSDQARGERLVEAGVGVLLELRKDRVGRSGEGGGREQHRPRGRRQPRQPSLDEPAHTPGYWQCLIRRQLAAASDQFPADLERVERVAAGELLQAHQRRARCVEAEPSHEQLVDPAEAEGPDADPQDPLVAEHPLELQRRGPSGFEPTRGQDQDGLVPEPAQGEPQSCRRRGVNPLQVVDGHEEWGAGGDQAEHRQRRDADRPLVDRPSPGVTVAPQERDLQDAPLRFRQRRQGVVDHQVEKVTERREGEPGLRAGRRARQCLPASLGRSIERSAPERGLPYPRLALEHDRPRAVVLRLDRT